MQIEKILMSHEVIKGKEMPMNSIVLRLDNKVILVCSKFNHSRKQNLELLVWLPTQNKWVCTYVKNEYTEMMWDYYRKHQQKRNHDFRKCENMMRHCRKKKCGSGGVRLGFCGQVTDYECRKDPFHDFRRVWN